MPPEIAQEIAEETVDCVLTVYDVTTFDLDALKAAVAKAVMAHTKDAQPVKSNN